MEFIQMKYETKKGTQIELEADKQWLKYYIEELVFQNGLPLKNTVSLLIPLKEFIQV